VGLKIELSHHYNFQEIVFFVVFALHCVIGGFITFWGIFPFRPYYTSIIVLGLVFIYRIRIDKILKFHLGFALIILISGLLNHSSLKSIFLGLRIPVISYTMYLVVDSFFKKTRSKISTALKWIAFLQLPVVLAQFFFSTFLIGHTSILIAEHDIRFGTFFIKSDPIMSLYLISLVIYFLFKKENLSKIDVFITITSSLTIFLASTKVLQLILLIILCYYLFTFSTYKQIFYSFIIITLFVSIFISTGYSTKFIGSFENFYNNTFEKRKAEQISAFEKGNYARLGAILYFLNQPVKILGDGPARYTNPLEGEMDLGLTGNDFKMYAEYGLIGLIFSILGIFIIVFTKLKRGIYRYLLALCLIGLSMTSDIYNNASLMFVTYLFIYFFKETEKLGYKSIYLLKL